jgi:hypothetical protein
MGLRAVFLQRRCVGTPQRIIYLPTQDTEQIQIKPESPDPISLNAWPTGGGGNGGLLHLTPDMRDALLADQLNEPQDDFTVFEVLDITKG